MKLLSTVVHSICFFVLVVLAVPYDEYFVLYRICTVPRSPLNHESRHVQDVRKASDEKGYCTCTEAILLHFPNKAGVKVDVQLIGRVVRFRVQVGRREDHVLR